MKNTCLYCKKEFNAIALEVRRGGGKYCSKKCYISSQFKSMKRVCGNCGKIFYKKPSVIKVNKGKYCSVKCAMIVKSKNMKGKRPKRTWIKGNIPWNKGKSGLQVSWCKGKKMSKGLCERMSLRMKGNIPWNKGKKFLAGDKNPNWRGGIMRDPYPFDFNEELKELIRKRDNYNCQLCGLPQEVHCRKLAVHHIDYDKKNIDPKNLTALCNKCHTKVNFKREYWENFFKLKEKI